MLKLLLIICHDNFTVGYNIIFDLAGQRIGFAQSSCNYEKYAPVEAAPPAAGPPTTASCLTYDKCSAVCEKDKDPYVASGSQLVTDSCTGVDKKNDCHVSCDAHGKVVRGNPKCPDSPWSECSASCVQHRNVGGDNCRLSPETRPCTSGQCPVAEGDFMILLDLKVKILPTDWSYVYSEIFISTLEAYLKVVRRSQQCTQLFIPYSCLGSHGIDRPAE